MYNLYLTKDILGSKEGRIKSTPYAVYSTENECKEKMIAILGGAANIPYLRVTTINEKTKTYDYGSHTLFYEISEEEQK